MPQYLLLTAAAYKLDRTNTRSTDPNDPTRIVQTGYTRTDAAVYYTINQKVSLQGNVENFRNKKYFINANGNDNVSPGYPGTARLALRWRF